MIGSTTDDAPVGAQALQPELASELRLPRPPGVFRRWLAAHPVAVDWIIVGSYLFGCLLVVLGSLVAAFAGPELEGVTPEAEAELHGLLTALSWPWVLVSALVVAITATALVFRRRYPLAGLVVVSLLMFLEQGLLAVPSSIAIVFLLWAIPVHRGVRLGWIGYAIAVACNTALVLLTSGTVTGFIGPAGVVVGGPIALADTIGISVISALWLLAVLMFAINLGNRRRYIEALIDRAHQLARDREQKAQLAAAAERARIAREMHDIVAHSLSVVVTLSEAASSAIETQPAAAKQAVERAAETGRSALTEMRRLLGVLNDDAAQDRSAAAAAPLTPQPGVAQLPELLRGFEEAGLRISLTEQGVSHGDAPQQLAVYRIAQEALTNALRYAGAGASIAVTLAHSAAGTRLEVVDAGSVERVSGERAPRPGIPGSGHGLAGAAERARVFGGTVDSGPHGRGWRLIAEVPVGEDQENEER